MGIFTFQKNIFCARNETISYYSLQTPMAFYPTWQAAATATSDQAWQNQFIQQIPQNGSAPVTATAIAPLNSIDFQQVN